MLKFKRIGSHTLPLPTYETEAAAGMDLRAAEYIELYPGRTIPIPAGFAVEIPPHFEGQIRPRSGLAAKHGVTVLNSPGTIDSDYRGELMVILVNHGSEKLEIEPGDRIAQLVLAPIARATQIEEVAELSTTQRGEGGLGSTGLR